MCGQIWGEEFKWPELKQLCIDFVNDNWEVIRDEISCNKTAILKRLRCTSKIAPQRCWGDERTIMVAALALARRITVLRKRSGEV